MSIKIFNVKNHRVDGDALRLLNDFSTNDFCGIIGTLPEGVTSAFTKSGSSISINSSLLSGTTFYLMGGGCLLTAEVSDISSRTGNGTYAVEVTLSNTDNFTKDTSTSVKIISNASVSGYTGRTIWTSGNTKFIIPLFSVSSGNVTSLAVVRSGKAWQDFLTQSAIDELLGELGNIYTHQSGSSGENNFHGKIGNYNIWNDSIYHLTSPNNTSTKVLQTTSSGTFTLPQSAYTSGAAYLSNHALQAGTLPVNCGGTGGTTKTAAKNSLGIFYGKELPADHDFSGATVSQGDVYFMILDR